MEIRGTQNQATVAKPLGKTRKRVEKMQKSTENDDSSSAEHFTDKSWSLAADGAELRFPTDDCFGVYLEIQRYEGDTRDGQFHGEGVASYEGGHLYKGMFSKGVMEGLGVLVCANRHKYEGEFVRNTPMGQGAFTWPDGSAYTGEVHSGKRHGTGTYTCPKHDVSYTGQWHRGKKHGKGTMFFNNKKSSWYKGDWVMNSREGSGERRYRSGDTYSGGWKNNMRHGEGTMIWVNLGQRYVGKWEHGVQHGLGKHIWILKNSSGTRYFQSPHYIGNFFKGQRHGQGSFYYAGGAIYKGGWRNNMKHGQGKFTTKDGRILEVEFVDDKVATARSDGLTVSERDLFVGDDMAIDIEYLLEKIPKRNHKTELRHVKSAVWCHRTELRLIYGFYCRLGRSPDDSLLMSRLQFWRLLKDCSIHAHELTLTQIDSFIRGKASVAEIHSPFTTVHLRELLSCLVVVAYYIYHEDMMSQSYLLASCFSKLLIDDILPNATKVKGFLFRQPEFAVEALKYTERCWEVFETFCGVYMPHRDDRTMTFRHLMLMFKHLRLLDDQLTSTRLVKIITAERVDPPCVGLEITFLEFFEVLIGCAEVKCLQVSETPEEDQVLLTSDNKSTENLPEETDDANGHSQLTGNVTSENVETGEMKGQDEHISPPAEHEARLHEEDVHSRKSQTHLLLQFQLFLEHHLFPAVAFYQKVTEKMEMLLKEQNNKGP
ncbi:radial spoke head 10 homolog B isoform X2 [Nothobranchius furzeri]|uniref:Transcript variant X2 n=1 Tax=Nothobranchius furzeri TaxID=105023 RepID=A0A9D2XP55_NOTFU|nr:radial spoke head 10 homolog B isoform X2 [Nothobranchius furzeri]KAF7204739.1 transcript variant X2 [Nothobranchius furzeri]